MENSDNRSNEAAELRKRAEMIDRENSIPSPDDLEALSPESIRLMLHELRVHQIELEMQNEELRRVQVELEGARARYFDLYNLAPVGYVTLSEKGLIQEANLTGASLLGVPRELLVQQPFSRFILKDDQDIYYLCRKGLVETGAPQVCELRMVKQNGVFFWVQLEATAEQGIAGQRMHRVVLSDITERKFREEEHALTASLVLQITSGGDFRDKMSNLTGSLQGWTGCEAVGIRLRAGEDYPYYETRGFPAAFVEMENHLCACDLEGQLLRDGAGNPVLECMCGNILRGRFDPGKPFFTVRGSFWSNHTSALLADTSEADRQGRMRNRCNSMGYESLALIPLRDGGQVFGLLQFNDHRPGCFSPARIAQYERVADSLALALSRRQAEEALRQTQALLQAAMDQSQAGIAIADAPDGKLRYVNNAGLLIRGGDRPTVVNGIGIDQFVASWQLLDLDGTPLKTDQVPLTRAIMFGETNSREFIIRRACNDDRIVMAKAAPVMGENGEVAAGIVVFMDITEQKRQEAELKQKNDEFARFLFTVSHDLKSPLITIKTFMTYIEQDVQKQNEAALAKDMGYVRNAADKMGRLLDELLKLARVGHQIDTPEYTPLQTIAQAAVDLVAGRIAQCQVEVVITGQPVVLYGDMQRLVALYQNLLDNAIKFMGDQPKPRIEIGAEPDGGAVKLWVRDNGGGIESRFQHKLFGLFEKLEPQSEGVGMGLAIVKRIVEVHGGTIWVESEGLGKGTTFYFNLAQTELKRT